MKNITKRKIKKLLFPVLRTVRTNIFFFQIQMSNYKLNVFQRSENNFQY